MTISEALTELAVLVAALAATNTNAAYVGSLTAETGSDKLKVAKETAAQRTSRMAWWREARFGMFIHYSPVTLTGKEIGWSRANSNTNCPNHGSTSVAVYDNLYKTVNPTNFNAAEWVWVAKAAGMKYIVLSAKHCDGFLLWDSKVEVYHIMELDGSAMGIPAITLPALRSTQR